MDTRKKPVITHWQIVLRSGSARCSAVEIGRSVRGDAPSLVSSEKEVPLGYRQLGAEEYSSDVERYCYENFGVFLRPLEEHESLELLGTRSGAA
jgi:hypothetical protein